MVVISSWDVWGKTIICFTHHRRWGFKSWLNSTFKDQNKTILNKFRTVKRDQEGVFREMVPLNECSETENVEPSFSSLPCRSVVASQRKLLRSVNHRACRAQIRFLLSQSHRGCGRRMRRRWWWWRRALAGSILRKVERLRHWGLNSVRPAEF